MAHYDYRGGVGPHVRRQVDTVAAAGAKSGNVSFTTDLQDAGSYTITETNKTGWDYVSSSSECSFTVSYPTDAARTYTCTITNRQRGHVQVTKTVLGSSNLNGRSFTFDLRSGASLASPGTVLEGPKTVDALHNPVTFATNKLVLAVQKGSSIHSVYDLRRDGIKLVVGAAGTARFRTTVGSRQTAATRASSTTSCATTSRSRPAS